MFNDQAKALRRYCNNVLDDDVYPVDDFNNIDYLKIFFKAGENENIHAYAGSNVAILKTEHNGEDHFMMVFAISLNQESGSIKMKQISEKITNIVKRVEAAFITFDYINCKTVKEDHNEYVIILKKISDDIDNEFFED